MGRQQSRPAPAAVPACPMVHPLILPPATGFLPLLCVGRSWTWDFVPIQGEARP